MRRLRAVLHQRGHGVRAARLGRAVHPVQVHQDARAEGKLTYERNQNTRFHFVSGILFFLFFTIIMAEVFQNLQVAFHRYKWRKIHNVSGSVICQRLPEKPFTT